MNTQDITTVALWHNITVARQSASAEQRQDARQTIFLIMRTTREPVIRDTALGVLSILAKREARFARGAA